MSPAKRTTRKPAPKPARKTVRKTVRRVAAKPVAPPTWTGSVKGLSTVWYMMNDWEGAKKFFGETLGLPVAFAAEEMGWVEYGKRGQPTLAIGKNNEKAAPSQSSAIAVLEVNDIRAFFDELKAKGIRCDKIEDVSGMVLLGSFYDPEGHMLQMSQTVAMPS